jgi:hypothetical protein
LKIAEHRVGLDDCKSSFDCHELSSGVFKCGRLDAGATKSGNNLGPEDPSYSCSFQGGGESAA